MFITSNDNLENLVGEKIKVIGKFVKMEDDKIILQTNGMEVKINYKDLHKYTNQVVCITGTVCSDLSIDEIYVDQLGDGFDIGLFEETVKIGRHFPTIF